MTTTDPLAALAASPVPFDLYREVHKGLRFALFQATVAIGSADLEAPDERAEVARRVHAVVELLHVHHGHEDTFIEPLLVAHAAELSAIVDAGHAEIDAALAELQVEADRLAAADGPAAIRSGHALYGRLALFTATYLAHMALEEGAVMAALRDAVSLGELFELEMALRGSVAPPTMCAFMAVMLPAMNPGERAAMLGGMQAGAPPEVFAVFRQAAEDALPADDYRTLALRVGLD